MKTHKFILFALAVISTAMPVSAQVPLNVEGIVDRNYGSYMGHATFRVPSADGYSYRVVLDGTNLLPTDAWMDVSSVDYHELLAWRTNLLTGDITNTLVRFIVRDPVRNANQSAEDGLPAFTPWPPINSGKEEFAGGRLKLITPQNFPAGYEIPVVAWVEDPQGHAMRVNGLLGSPGQPAIQIKRGVGSGFLPATNVAGLLNYAPAIQGLTTNKLINLETNTAWIDVTGTLTNSVDWGNNARVVVTGTLTVSSAATLTVGAGSIVRINPGVDIYLDGKLVVNGSLDEPVVFMPNAPSQPWGGFWLRFASSQISGTGVVFTGSGANQNWFGSSGRPGSHRKEQALFYCTNYSTVTLTDSAAIRLAGQLSHSVGANGSARFFFNYTHFLFQGGTSGGEHTDSIWTVNDSAFIDTYDASIPYYQFNDGDEDAIYLVNAPAPYVTGFTNTLIGWTRDDGIDSGGSGPGVFRFKSCWFESTYHEGNSLSGVSSSSPHADKDSAHIDGVFIGCGQGYENGYGGVTGKVDHCLMLSGEIGFRFGDNYNWGYYGRHYAANSILINNHRDVWGMTWQSDTSGPYEGWVYRSAAMDVRSNFLSVPNPYHPSNFIWNPAADGWRLVPFMTVSPEAAVGIGFAVWTNGFAMPDLFQGVPVGLSIFTTNFVSVDYTFENNNATLAGGTLTFAPGETVKRIYPAGFNLADQSLVRIVLRNPVCGELTGETNVTFQGTVPAAQIVCLGGRQKDVARLGEGLAVGLTNPSSEDVTVDYRLESSSQILASGTLTFPAGQMIQWISVPDIVPANYSLLRLALSNPTWAQLGTPSSYYLVKTAPVTTSQATTLVPRGARWNYYDSVTNGMAGWASTDFNDSSWGSGPAPLGYGNNPKEATTVGYGPNSSAKYITTYFRTHFNVTDATSLSDITFNLLRDDGAGVYLNGAEVYRENMPLSPAVITYTTAATATVSGTASVWNSRSFPVDGLPVPLHDGTNLLAVEIHQSGGGSSDIILDLELIGNPAPLPGSQPSIYWGKFDTDTLVLAWSDPSYVLVQATNVAGPYIDSLSVSPLSLNATNQQSYFRLRR